MPNYRISYELQFDGQKMAKEQDSVEADNAKKALSAFLAGKSIKLKVNFDRGFDMAVAWEKPNRCYRAERVQK